MTRLPWLDALRGWAIIMVVIVHAGQISAIGLRADQWSVGAARIFSDLGQYGVQLFFVVSAITICMTLQSLTDKHGFSWQSIVAWYTKRFFRLAPQFYFIILLYSLVRIFRPEILIAPFQATYMQTLANLAFVHSWVPSAINNVVPGAWSLGVEFTFYLLAPLVVVGLRKPMVLFPALYLVCIISLLTTVSGSGGLVENNLYFYLWFPTQMPVFAAGIIVYYFCAFTRRSNSFQPTHIRWPALAMALFFGAASAWLGTVGQVDHGFAPLAFGICFGFLALAIAATDSNLIVNPILRVIGRYSYGIYLVHYGLILIIASYASNFVPYLPNNGFLRLALFSSVVFLPSLSISWILNFLVEAPGISVGGSLADRVLAKKAKLALL